MANESPDIESNSWTSSNDRSVGHSTDQQSASSISVEPQLLLERILTLEIVRVAERAAVAAARLRGQGSEMKARRAAADAMRRELNALPIEGIVVISDGKRDEASALLVGEKVGTEGGPVFDIAANPLEGTTLCAKGMPDAMATIAIADRRTLLSVPDAYMEKIAIGPGYPKGIIDLDAPPEENIAALARAKGVEPSAITALILDRPRHNSLVAAVRRAGATVRFITDGDVAGVIYTAEPTATGVDVYIGVGGAPQGVLAAAALRCVGGQMQARLVLDTSDKRERASEMGIADVSRKYTIDEMVRGDCLFAATGVTDGSMLRGVGFGKDIIATQTVVMRSTTGTVRRIMTQHRSHGKFQFG
jgi:fructose-1,6-bisphosphatase II / sedoheptulose-1,7-bisphosphatase